MIMEHTIIRPKIRPGTKKTNCTKRIHALDIMLNTPLQFVLLLFSIEGIV